jgi:hypothetical protein
MKCIGVEIPVATCVVGYKTLDGFDAYFSSAITVWESHRGKA